MCGMLLWCPAYKQYTRVLMAVWWSIDRCADGGARCAGTLLLLLLVPSLSPLSSPSLPSSTADLAAAAVVTSESAAEVTSSVTSARRRRSLSVAETTSLSSVAVGPVVWSPVVVSLLALSVVRGLYTTWMSHARTQIDGNNGVRRSCPFLPRMHSIARY